MSVIPPGSLLWFSARVRVSHYVLCWYNELFSLLAPTRFDLRVRPCGDVSNTSLHLHTVNPFRQRQGLRLFQPPLHAPHPTQSSAWYAVRTPVLLIIVMTSTAFAVFIRFVLVQLLAITLNMQLSSPLPYILDPCRTRRL